MLKWLALPLASSVVHAAVIGGTVVEGQSGRPLARALVTLEPVPGTAAQAASTRTNQYGAFGFSGLAAGSYLITASRLGFAPVQYGQKRWKAGGVPVPVDTNGSPNLIIRLPRLGAVTGSILDENDVGLPEHDVVAYRAARPLQVAARARTDDRGRYRLWGLEPGKYFVRAAAKEYDDGGYVPTFHRDAQRVEGATTVDVELDRETTDVNVHAISGRLVNISGQIAPPAQISVTLVSDTGAETTISDPLGNFHFNPAAPGAYELYAQAPADSRLGIQAAYMALNVNSDRSDLRLTLRPLPQLQFVFRDTKGQLIDYHAMRVMARRKDLAGTGKTQTLELAGDRLAFLPGRWELALAPAPGLFVSSLSASRPQLGEPGRADGWNEFLINGAGDQVQFVLSATPGAVHGTVLGPGLLPAVGAPVYLEAFDPNARRRVKELQITHADSLGRYRFADLAPGSYRLLSSFDFDATDGPLEVRGAKTLKVDEARDLVQDLELL
jgi:hypothetical protein